MPAESYLNNLYSSLAGEVVLRSKVQKEGAKPRGLHLIEVSNVDLNVHVNAHEHHTDKYEQTDGPPYRLMIRRGQSFDMRLHLNRRYDHQTDAFMLQFSFGEHPSEETKTQRMLPVGGLDHDLGNKWAAKLLRVDHHYIDVQVNTSANTMVGEWKLNVYAGRRIYEQTRDFYITYVHLDYIFILFNPWCKEDSVYLEEEELREEYVLNDQGALFLGGKVGQYQACPWNYGQFEDVSLYAALIALRQGDYMTDQERSDAVLTVRRLTAAVNDNILRGNWSSDYSGGTKPWEWTGTAAILEKYVDTPNELVKYGQCWVFSAVLMTLCRTLGVPCRSVTNIRSAHDSDRTLTIDNVFVRDAISSKFEDVGGSSDSIWNFHVWNEVWMTRPDLRTGDFGGWQAIDATPQEMSNGRYQCGPMSVKALRQADVNCNHDGWFIFGEMNADVINWYYVSDYGQPRGCRLIKSQADTTDVGRALVTSHVGDPTRAADITDNYKPKEGTAEERAQVRKAIRLCVGDEGEDEQVTPRVAASMTPDDVTFDMVDIDAVSVGQPIESRLTVTNNADHTRRIQIRLDLDILRYTGGVHANIYEMNDLIVLQPNKSHLIVIKLKESDYVERVGEHSQMRFSVVGHVQETDQIYDNKDIFQLIKPQLTISLENEANVNEATRVQVHLKNPFDTQTLSNCRLFIEAVGIARKLPIDIPRELEAGGELVGKCTVFPRRAGERRLLAVFSSDQLANVRGTLQVQVHG